MDARYVDRFTRGGDPYVKLGLSIKHIIIKWFSTYAPYVTYNIDGESHVFVKGGIRLMFSEVTWMPDATFHISHYLDLDHCQIDVLPDNLHVGGRMYINNTNIFALPENLFVGRDLWLLGTPLANLTRDELESKYPTVEIKGKIYNSI